MKTKQFKCTLLSDAVMSDTSATEGRRGSLDFIPGNNFLGIVANELYDEGNGDSYLLFHSGKVRFGDANPSRGHTRGLRVPASMYYPKLESLESECFIHHAIDDFDSLKQKQLKQARNGFYTFEDGHAGEVKVERDFAIKSAYDSKRRRAKDGEMFGYESIAQGTELFFEVAFDDDVPERVVGEVEKALTGRRHIGRSRTAQYGWVEIEPWQFGEQKTGKGDGQTATVYADGRLIFFDAEGMPTLRPQAGDLGLEGEIDWEKSQVRTFQYAPWNFKRQAFDSDRIGMEKGSVLVVRTPDKVSGSNYVGAYQNEGFGKVVYNPAFLDTVEKSNGKAAIIFDKEKEKESPQTAASFTDSVLQAFLLNRKDEQEKERKAYDIVEKFVSDNAYRFKGQRFSSQWGAIRSIAMSTEPTKIEGAIKEFVGHGVAKEQWENEGRRKLLEELMDKPEVQADIQNIIINLASEMAKKTRQ